MQIFIGIVGILLVLGGLPGNGGSWSVGHIVVGLVLLATAAKWKTSKH